MPKDVKERAKLGLWVAFQGLQSTQQQEIDEILLQKNISWRNIENSPRYSKTCLKRIPKRPENLPALDRCLPYRYYVRFVHYDQFVGNASSRWLE